MQVHGNGYILTVFSGNTKITDRGKLLLVFLWWCHFLLFEWSQQIICGLFLQFCILVLTALLTTCSFFLVTHQQTILGEKLMKKTVYKVSSIYSSSPNQWRKATTVHLISHVYFKDWIFHLNSAWSVKINMKKHLWELMFQSSVSIDSQDILFHSKIQELLIC